MSETTQHPAQNRQVRIYTESNPNPNSMKFMLNFMICEDGQNFDFPDRTAAEASPLAQELFGFEGVERVFFMSNFVTVTKAESADWHTMIGQIKPFLTQYFEAQKPLFGEAQEAQPVIEESDTPQVKKIKMVLDEYVRPAVESDGGAIVYQSFDEASGIVKVLLQGSCSGCPSSTLTLKAGIENLLKRMVPQVKEVVAENG